MKRSFSFFLLTTLLLASIGLFGFSVYKYKKLSVESKNAVANLANELANEIQKGEHLQSTLQEKENTVGALESQVGEIAFTVGNLQKLKSLDSELLKKYSKVYFLNENYIPKELSEIDKDFLWNKEETEKIHSSVLPFLAKLITDARRDGMDIEIISAYRSFGMQSALKNGYLTTFGSGANKFSADQGYSEHQLGTTIDFTTAEVANTFSGFSKTEEYKWLQSNAYKYGFILSYPANNSYYQFEPWHWRFVGVELSKHLHEENKFFYDLDQREIDSYLIKIFD